MPALRLDLQSINTFNIGQFQDEAEVIHGTLQSRDLSRLRVVTWNIWFDDLQAELRLRKLLEVILTLSPAPDIICLQEVTPAAASALRACGGLCSVYEISPFDVNVYGNIIMAQLDLNPVFTEIELPSEMDRRLVLVDCQARLNGLLVANVHLESLAAEHIRRQQLEVAAEVLSGRSCALLCGDFNFDATRTYGDWEAEITESSLASLENNVLAQIFPDFIDVWPAVRPDEGFTFDGHENPQCVDNPEERMRYDRVLAKVNDKGLSPLEASLLGTDDITSWGLKPSDHFGLQVDILISSTIDSQKASNSDSLLASPTSGCDSTNGSLQTSPTKTRTTTSDSQKSKSSSQSMLS